MKAIPECWTWSGPVDVDPLEGTTLEFIESSAVFGDAAGNTIKRCSTRTNPHSDQWEYHPAVPANDLAPVWNGTNPTTMKSTHVLVGDVYQEDQWSDQYDEDEVPQYGVTYLGEATFPPELVPYLIEQGTPIVQKGGKYPEFALNEEGEAIQEGWTAHIVRPVQGADPAEWEAYMAAHDLVEAAHPELTCQDPNGYCADPSACAGRVFWVDNQGLQVCEFHGKAENIPRYEDGELLWPTYYFRDLTDEEREIVESDEQQ